ncbi:glycoside hydrolase family 6 protein [Nocardioides zeae]|uniref:Glucanase n=1 Tax=Nocardioides zeae TaxID=1457234 RepID=A0AAJ1X516_9ACTN|nr:glycoside hydrolase family 6 protein [Nocardioides zeae]MDQ1106177.1 endoglucanase [Nocardioides zeae]
MSPRRAPWTVAGVAVVTLLLSLLSPGGTPVAGASPAAAAAPAAAPAALDPRLTRGLLVDPSSLAMKAAAKDAAFKPIAGVAQARWFTSALPVSRARSTAKAWGDLGVRSARTPLVAIYALPGRDCGGHSAGGFDATTYRSWIREVAAGLKGSRAVAVLEPDALALLGSCSGQESWLPLIRYAAQQLQAAGVWVYLDAGHSSWQPASVMADRIAQAGIAYARGVAVNVSNYQRTNTVGAYGQQVVAELAKRGARNKTVLVDSSRNGAGAPADGQWCNPTSARLGMTTRVVNAKSIDFVAWIKRPGESDGTCNGGPPAGQWWPAGAKRLMATP